MKPKSKILVIAGSDSSGGAGIQADIKTITSLGSYAMTAITAITAQNTTGVVSVFPIPPDELKKQILFTCKDIKPDAIKIGMLHSKSIIKAVIESLNKISNKKIILDPVMIAKGGAKLINNAAIDFIKYKLVKKTYLITPNIPEAEVLSELKIKNTKDMINAAKILLNFGVKNVLIKGGHLKSKTLTDIYLNNSELVILLVSSALIIFSIFFILSKFCIYLSIFPSLLIFFCSCKMPYSKASADGGQPGTYMSTGTTLSQPLTTEYE